MTDIIIKRKPFIIGIIGSHKAESASLGDAFLLGKAIAEAGYALLTGGGTGIMEAASKGAHLAGGLVLAILPNEKGKPPAGYPNPFVDIPIYTGMSDARNIINAKTPHAIIALNGGFGTLSEIAIALKSGTPVIGLGTAHFDYAAGAPYYPVTSVDQALATLSRIMKQISRTPAERKDGQDNRPTGS